MIAKLNALLGKSDVRMLKARISMSLSKGRKTWIGNNITEQFSSIVEIIKQR